MKDSIRRKLEKLDERYEEISRLLSDAGVISRQNQFRELSMEYARLGALVDRYRRFIALEGDQGIAAAEGKPVPGGGPQRDGGHVMVQRAERHQAAAAARSTGCCSSHAWRTPLGR